MIDLKYTKEQMAADINATEKKLVNCSSDPSAPDVVLQDEARFIVKGNTPREILPVLNTLYVKRFSKVSSDQLFRDLTYLVKKGVGNAYKWGNRKDPSKKIVVESVVTQNGALVAISDEGNGFDVNGVLGKFQNDEQYFSHGGSGFVHFQKAKSLVSYADNGRTLLIRFLSIAGLGAPIHGKDHFMLGLAGNEEFMKSFLGANLPPFRNRTAVLEACRIFLPDKPKKDEVEIKYLLEGRRGQSKSNVTLLGRVLPEIASRTDFSVSRQLYQGAFRKVRTIHVPKPLAVFQHPSLVCFKFNPSKDLKEYLKGISDSQEVLKVIKSVAVGLRCIHRSRIAIEIERVLEDEMQQFETIRERVIAQLGTVHPQRVELVRKIFQQFLDRATLVNPYKRVPIHGAFSWNSILSDDKRLYVFRFDQCRRSHPGLDVGGFLADLFRFYVLRKKSDSDFYHAAREVFLEAYSPGRPLPWHKDLPFFILGGMLISLDRLLQRPEKKWSEKVDALLAQCMNVLQEDR